MTTLNIDKSNLTIMGVKFDSQKEFKGVWYALSTNMIEGWEPEKRCRRNEVIYHSKE